MSASTERLIHRERTGPAVNPVLPGFHPDPCLIRVGTEYLLATSTFHWFPGVALYSSDDLATWTQLPHPLTRTGQLDLLGVPDAGGVWAPDLSYVDGQFHLVYSNVVGYNVDGFYDAPNYHVYADRIEGPWSDPVPLHARGFDASLFHDGAESYLLAMEWDHRPGRTHFAGILLQRFDRVTRTLTGPAHRIFTGTALGITEGPRMYRRGRWYYLVVAEGGTGLDHAVTVARSTSLLGPYEPDPNGPMLTSRDRPDLPLRKAGHASLVDTPSGDWVLAHLAARPVGQHERSILGRETAVQRFDWSADGWPRVAGGVPALVPDLPGNPRARRTRTDRDDFDAIRLAPAWQTVRRVPEQSWLSLTERPGWVRLRGDQTPASRHRVSLLARRQRSHRCRFQIRIDAQPTHFQQMAGLVHYYDSTLWHWLHLTHDPEIGRCLRVLTCDNGRLIDPVGEPIPWPDPNPVWLRADIDNDELSFSAAEDGHVGWRRIGPVLDASILSDEYATRPPTPGTTPIMGFTGAFLGFCVTDLTGARLTCDVDTATVIDR